MVDDFSQPDRLIDSVIYKIGSGVIYSKYLFFFLEFYSVVPIPHCCQKV